MNKRRCYNNPSFDHTKYFNNTTSPPTLDTAIQEVHPNYGNSSSAIDTVQAIFTVTEVKSEPSDPNTLPSTGRTATILDGLAIKEEPEDGDTDDEEEDSTDTMIDQYENQFVANTIIKEEIMIECEPDVDVFEITKSGTGNDTQENHQNQQFSKRRKKVYKNWQKDKVFALDSDALGVIRNERIWTKYTTNRTDKGSKVIYRCRNVKSRGQQCEAGIYLLYSHTDTSVTLFRSINRHTCDSIESKRKRPIKLENKKETNKIECDTNPVKTDENQPNLKRRRKTVKNWQKERTFELEDAAIASVKDEQTWAKYTTNKTDKGNKVIYRCRNVKSRGPQCEAGVYLLYSLIDPIITLFRSVNKHTCDTIESKRKPYVRCKSKIKIKTEQIIKNDENEKKSRRRKKVVKNWQKEKAFGLEVEALEAVKIEQTWTKYTTNKTDKGSKVIYRCRNVKSKGQQCDAGVYLWYATDATVTMYRSANKHTCDIIESKSKSTLNDEAKHIIRTEYEKGLKPKHILSIVIAKGFNCRQIQINNYLAQLRRDAYQSSVFTLKDFANTIQDAKAWSDGIDDHDAIKSYSKQNHSEH